MTTSYKVAILLYEGVDLLDFAGPIEVLTDVKHPPSTNTATTTRPFTITTISQTHTIKTASQALTLKPDLLLPDALLTIQDYDILLVPGASGPIIDTLIASPPPEVDFIRRFAALGPKTEEGGRQRVLFSVCTGAVLVGLAGVLNGGRVRVATHHRFLGVLRQVCQVLNGGVDGVDGVPEVVSRRIVDSGVIGVKSGSGNEREGVWLVSAGGVSSGIDAALYLVRRLFGDEAARCVEKDMEYEAVGV
ncbi:hypothetical protein BBP40_010291 [Aspergillus hancockii]|nr:hypothetical protein BBP40_010291 [Aspergillus hancockii]